MGPARQSNGPRGSFSKPMLVARIVGRSADMGTILPNFEAYICMTGRTSTVPIWAHGMVAARSVASWSGWQSRT